VTNLLEAMSNACSMEKPWHESNNVRANVAQTARSGARSRAATETHKTEGTPYL
jgi:hypothetical protein